MKQRCWELLAKYCETERFTARLSVGVPDHSAQALREFLVFEEFLEGEVDAVAPVMMANGRNVDAFLCRIRDSQPRLEREQVL